MPRLIPLLTEMSLQQVLDQDFVQVLLGPLMERHWAALELIKQRATVEGGVITFDITDQPTEGYNKFIPYYLYPEATYNVGLSKSSFRTKVSVGTNPWTKKPPSELVNLAEICERYGGGGHARVGAISFPPDREDEARKAVGEIVAELRRAGSDSAQEKVGAGMMWPVRCALQFISLKEVVARMIRLGCCSRLLFVSFLSRLRSAWRGAR